MNNKIALKMSLDVALTALFILLMSISATGMLWHEILGLAVFFLVVFHNLLNLSWIKGITRALWDRKPVKIKTTSMYALDLLLWVCVLITTISGILISKELFSSLSVGDQGIWAALHTSAAYLCLILISVHVGFHWSSILRAFQKMMRMNEENSLRKFALRVFAFCLALLGIRASFTNDIGQKLFSPFILQDSGNEDQLSAELTEKQESLRSQDLSDNPVVSSDSSDAKTLDEYLSSLFCSGCHKRCSLLSPRCSKGMRQAQQAEVQYDSSAQQDSDSQIQNDYGSNSQAETNTESETFVENIQTVSDPFINYIPVMSLYISGAYYTVEFMGRKKTP